MSRGDAVEVASRAPQPRGGYLKPSSMQVVLSTGDGRVYRASWGQKTVRRTVEMLTDLYVGTGEESVFASALRGARSMDSERPSAGRPNEEHVERLCATVSASRGAHGHSPASTQDAAVHALANLTRYEIAQPSLGKSGVPFSKQSVDAVRGMAERLSTMLRAVGGADVRRGPAWDGPAFSGSADYLCGGCAVVVRHSSKQAATKEDTLLGLMLCCLAERCGCDVDAMAVANPVTGTMYRAYLSDISKRTLDEVRAIVSGARTV